MQSVIVLFDTVSKEQVSENKQKKVESQARVPAGNTAALETANLDPLAVPTNTLDNLPSHPTATRYRQATVRHLQRKLGNQYIQRMLGHTQPNRTELPTALQLPELKSNDLINPVSKPTHTIQRNPPTDPKKGTNKSDQSKTDDTDKQQTEETEVSEPDTVQGQWPQSSQPDDDGEQNYTPDPQFYNEGEQNYTPDPQFNEDEQSYSPLLDPQDEQNYSPLLDEPQYGEGEQNYSPLTDDSSYSSDPQSPVPSPLPEPKQKSGDKGTNKDQSLEEPVYGPQQEQVQDVAPDDNKESVDEQKDKFRKGGKAKEVSEWQDNFSSSMSEMADPDTSQLECLPEDLETSSQSTVDGYEQERESSDYLGEARGIVGEPDKMEEPPPPPPPKDPVPKATEKMAAAIGKRLSDQSLPDIEASPRGTLPKVNGSSLFDATQYMGIGSPELTGDEIVNPGITQVGEKLAKPPDDRDEAGSAPGVTLTDPGPPEKKALPEDMKSQIGDAIADLLRSVDSHANRLVDGAVNRAYPNKILADVAPDVATNFIDSETEYLDGYMRKIAEAAGVAQTTLDEKVAGQCLVLDETQQSVTDGLISVGDTARTDLEEEGKKTQEDLTSASETVQYEMEYKQEAASGQPDPAAIERKRDNLVDKITSDASNAKIEYEQALKLRESELDKAGDAQALAYQMTAQRDAKAVRDAYTASQKQSSDDSGSDGTIQRFDTGVFLPEDIASRLEARKMTNWGETKAKNVREAVYKLKEAARTEVAEYQLDLVGATILSKELVRSWADDKLGRDRTWLARLIDLVRDWMRQAQSDKDTWEEVKIENHATQMANDFEALAELRGAMADQNAELAKELYKNMSDEQQQIANLFLVSGGDSITAVGQGLMMRVRKGRIPDLIEEIKEDVLELSKEVLNQIGAAQTNGFDAESIARDVRSAVRGWGTDEAQLFAALKRRTPEQVEAMRLYYRDIYDRDMESDIEGDLSGSEEDRAMSALDSDFVGDDVANLHYAMKGNNIFDSLGTDEDAIMDVLRNKSYQERQEIMARYKEEYGVDLTTHLDGELGGHDMLEAEAHLEGDTAKADAIAIDRAMNGTWWGLGFGTDEAGAGAVYDRVREEVEKKGERLGMTSAEIEAEIQQRNLEIEMKYNDEFADGDPAGLREEFDDEFDLPGEHAWINALADNDMIAADAARIKMETESTWYADDDVITETLEKQYTRAEKAVRRDMLLELKERAIAEQWDADRIMQERKEMEKKVKERAREIGFQNMGDLEDQFNESFQVYSFSSDFRDYVEHYTQGYSEDEAFDLIAQGGYLTDAQKVYYAVHGLGTDEDGLEKVFKGKSPEEVEKIRKDYESLPGKGEGAMDEDLFGGGLFSWGDLSGRDEFDIGNMVEGEPKTMKEKLDRLKERLDYELGESGIGYLLASEETRVLQNTYKQAKDIYEQYDDKYKTYSDIVCSIDGDKDNAEKLQADLTKLEKRFDEIVGYFDKDVESQRKRVDYLTDMAATVIGIAAAVVATIVVGVISGGTAAPALAAAWGVSLATAEAAIAAGAAAVGAMAAIGTKDIMKGDAYGWEDLTKDGSLAVIDVVSAGLTSKMGGQILGKLEKLQGDFATTIPSKLISKGIAEGTAGAVSGFPAILMNSLVDEGVWNSDNPIEAIAKKLGPQMAMAFAAGLVLGSLQEGGEMMWGKGNKDVGSTVTKGGDEPTTTSGGDGMEVDPAGAKLLDDIADDADSNLSTDSPTKDDGKVGDDVDPTTTPDPQQDVDIGDEIDPTINEKPEPEVETPTSSDPLIQELDNNAQELKSTLQKLREKHNAKMQETLDKLKKEYKQDLDEIYDNAPPGEREALIEKAQKKYNKEHQRLTDQYEQEWNDIIAKSDEEWEEILRRYEEGQTPTSDPVDDVPDWQKEIDELRQQGADDIEAYREKRGELREDLSEELDQLTETYAQKHKDLVERYGESGELKTAEGRAKFAKEQADLKAELEAKWTAAKERYDAQVEALSGQTTDTATDVSPDTEPAQPLTQEALNQQFDQLDQQFDLDELKSIAAKIGFDPEDIAGPAAGKSTYALNLVQRAREHGLAGNLGTALGAGSEDLQTLLAKLKTHNISGDTSQLTGEAATFEQLRKSYTREQLHDLARNLGFDPEDIASLHQGKSVFAFELQDAVQKHGIEEQFRTLLGLDPSDWSQVYKPSGLGNAQFNELHQEFSKAELQLLANHAGFDPEDIAGPGATKLVYLDDLLDSVRSHGVEAEFAEGLALLRGGQGSQLKTDVTRVFGPDEFIALHTHFDLSELEVVAYKLGIRDYLPSNAVSKSTFLDELFSAVEQRGIQDDLRRTLKDMGVPDDVVGTIKPHTSSDGSEVTTTSGQKTGAEIAEERGYTTPPDGYEWYRTGDDEVGLRRKRGMKDKVPPRYYDVDSGTFKIVDEFREAVIKEAEDLLASKGELAMLGHLRKKLGGVDADDVVSGRGMKTTDQHIAEFMEAIEEFDFTVPGKHPTFWSGGLDVAGEAATQGNLVSLEGSVGGKGIMEFTDTLNLEWDRAKPIWNRISELYAESVGKRYGGTDHPIYAFINNEHNPEGVYFTIEKPVLIGHGVNLVEVKGPPFVLPEQP